MWVIFLLSLAVSIDALGLGISLGVRKIRLSIRSAFIMSGVGFVTINLSMLAGKGIREVLSHNVSGIVLICVGVWVLLQAFNKNDDVGDVDGSGSIDCKEALCLGFVLSLDALGVGLGCAGMQFAVLLPVSAMALQMLLVFVGIRIGDIIGHYVNTCICTLFSGVLITIIGIINFFA